MLRDHESAAVPDKLTNEVELFVVQAFLVRQHQHPIFPKVFQVFVKNDVKGHPPLNHCLLE